MNKSILNLGKALNKTKQKTINGGMFWPSNERECLLCWGEWGGLCALPIDSPCL